MRRQECPIIFSRHRIPIPLRHCGPRRGLVLHLPGGWPDALAACGTPFRLIPCTGVGRTTTAIACPDRRKTREDLSASGDFGHAARRLWTRCRPGSCCSVASWQPAQAPARCGSFRLSAPPCRQAAQSAARDARTPSRHHWNICPARGPCPACCVAIRRFEPLLPPRPADLPSRKQVAGPAPDTPTRSYGQQDSPGNSVFVPRSGTSSIHRSRARGSAARATPPPFQWVAMAREMGRTATDAERQPQSRAQDGFCAGAAAAVACTGRSQSRRQGRAPHRCGPHAAERTGTGPHRVAADSEQLPSQIECTRRLRSPCRDAVDFALHVPPPPFPGLTPDRPRHHLRSWPAPSIPECTPSSLPSLETPCPATGTQDRRVGNSPALSAAAKQQMVAAGGRAIAPSQVPMRVRRPPAPPAPDWPAVAGPERSSAATFLRRPTAPPDQRCHARRQHRGFGAASSETGRSMRVRDRPAPAAVELFNSSPVPSGRPGLPAGNP